MGRNRDTAPKLRVLIALVVDLGSIPSASWCLIHNSNFMYALFLTFTDTSIHVEHIHTYTGETFKYIKLKRIRDKSMWEKKNIEYLLCTIY